MSFTLVARIWEYKFAPSERSILQAMADHADETGGSVWPSVARIAWKTDYSERQVQRCIHGLAARGVLIVVRPACGRRPTEYRINLDAAERKPSFAAKGDTMSPRQDVTPDKMSPLATRKDDTTSPIANGRGDIRDIVGVTFATPRGDVVSPEPTREQTKKNRPREIHPPYPPDFETWWDACPSRMRRSGKSETFDAWIKATPRRPPLADMLRVLALHAASHDWTKEGGQFVPMATTYLNRSRWEAEVSAYVPNGRNGHGPPPEHGNMAPIRAEPTPVEVAWASASPEEHAMGRTAFYAAFNRREEARQ